MDIYEILSTSKGVDFRGLDKLNSVLIGEHRVPVLAYAFFSKEELKSSVDFNNMIGKDGELLLHSSRDECVTSTFFKGEDGEEDVWLMLYIQVEGSKENFLLKKMAYLGMHSPDSQFSIDEEFMSTDAADPILYMTKTESPTPLFCESSQSFN
tara:strand:- start:260 stop:718 length:459 start_codon:yes stop_codon:yes gene_type:complete